MRRMLLFLCSLVSCTVIPIGSLAGEEPQPGEFPRLNFSGSVRFRYEGLDNYSIRKYGLDEEDSIFLTRLRLAGELLLKKNVRAFVEIQDARFFSEELKLDDFPSSCPYENRLDLRQGFIEAKHLWEEPWGFKIGRQAISYADGRIWGPGDWGNTGRYLWDGGKLYYHTDAIQLDAIAAERVLPNALKFDGNHYTYQAYGLYANLPQLKPLTLNLFYAFKRDAHETTKGESGTGDVNRHTVGAYAKGEFGDGFDASGTVACQFGTEGKDDVRAYGCTGQLGYQFEVPLRPRIYGAYTYASGDSNPTDGKNQTFDGVFGAVDQYYGRMNFLAWMNLIDYQLGASIRPVNKLQLSADYHVFALAQKKDAWYYCNCKPQRRDKTGAAGDNIGQEIDLVAKYDVPMGNSPIASAIKKIELMAGYSYFVPGDFVKATGSAGDANWMFFQTMLSF
ncbi:MAG TPA: alginate export family protein [Planctomycetota bacterium]|nr:alginate export family protein [Planctomycetota bacterium]